MVFHLYFKTIFNLINSLEGSFAGEPKSTLKIRFVIGSHQRRKNMKTLRGPVGLALLYLLVTLFSLSMATRQLGVVFNSLHEFFADEQFFDPNNGVFALTTGIPKAVDGVA